MRIAREKCQAFHPDADFFLSNVARFMEPIPPYTYGLPLLFAGSGLKEFMRVTFFE
jgi:hypothetical protein